MAVVAVTADNSRWDDMNATTNTGTIGGGSGEGAEPDFVYQGTNSVSRKVGTSALGFFTDTGATRDVTVDATRTIIFKIIATNSNALELVSVPGIQIRIGSGASDYYSYDLEGSDTYPIKGGWLIRPIDPNVASYRDGTTGTPVLTAADYFGIVGDFTATSKSENLAMDAIDAGRGLNLVGGDGADTDGVWQDFVDDDEGDTGATTGRYGYIYTTAASGSTSIIMECYGMFWIGRDTTPTTTATVFSDSGKTLIFPSGLFNAGWSGVSVDLGNATTDVDFTDSNFFGLADGTGVDTRPVLTIIGTSGAFDATGCVFDRFATLTLTSASTLTNCTVSNSESLVQDGATISDCQFLGATTADGVAFIESDTPNLISDCSFTFSDGHAIEITNTGTYSFSGNTFSGYGADGTNDAAIYNNSGGAVTINVESGGDTPTVRNGSGASTTINNTVTVSAHVQDEDKVAIQNAQFYLQKETPTVFTSGVGNSAGDADLVVTQTIDSDMPQTGWVNVLDISLNRTLPYRYVSHDELNTFTFASELTGSATSAGTSTTLVSTSTNFLTADIEEGDTIRNTTDGSYAVVDEIVDADNITTSPLSGGSDNSWQSSDNFSVHRLATSLDSGVDLIDVPLLNAQTDSNGDVSLSYNYASDLEVIFRVRFSPSSGTKYKQGNGSGTITSAGLPITVTLVEDTVA